jgi:HK97 family phage major capsid protein
MSWVPVSFEAFDDMASGAEEVAKLLRDEADLTDAEAFQVGTGSGQPTGIVTALTGTASEVNQTGTTLDTADFFAVQEALGPRFQANPSWIMHLVSLHRARQIITGTGLTSPLLDDQSSPRGCSASQPTRPVSWTRR